MHGNDMLDDPRLIAKIIDENNRRLSRTRSGVSDTSASHAKLPLLLSGEALRKQSAENEGRVCRFIADCRGEPAVADPAAVRQGLFVLADLTNAGLLPAGRLRIWDVPYRRAAVEDDGCLPSPCRPVSPSELPQALEIFCETVFSRIEELNHDPVPLAAWAEWHLNAGPLHPFYDGCGRVSRSFAAWLLVKASHLLPLYEDGTSYFAHTERGPRLFADYMRERIRTCVQWVETLGSEPPAGKSQ